MDLLYIDEEQSQRSKVVRAADRSVFFTKDQIDVLAPKQTLDDTIQEIVDRKCKILISDYNLSENDPDVEFNGLELVQEFRRRYNSFPCLVITSHIDQAIAEHIDSDIIFPKSDFLDQDKDERSQSDFPFFQRVRMKIDDYKRLVERKEERLKELESKRQKHLLNSNEIEELIEIDSFLEASLGSHSSIPKHLKEKALGPFSDLVSKTEQLLEKIEKEISE